MTDAELIEAVATEVMGWQSCRTFFGDGMKRYSWCVDGIGEQSWRAYRMCHGNVGRDGVDEVWNPLANDVDMSMVLERVHKKGVAGFSVGFMAQPGTKIKMWTEQEAKRAMLQAIVEASQ